MSKVISCIAFIPFFIASCRAWTAATSCAEQCDQFTVVATHNYYNGDGDLCTEYQSITQNTESPCNTEVMWVVLGLTKSDKNQQGITSTEWDSLITDFRYIDNQGNGGLASKIQPSTTGGVNGIAIKLRFNNDREWVLCTKDIWVDGPNGAGDEPRKGHVAGDVTYSDYSNQIRLKYGSNNNYNCLTENYFYGLPIVDETKLIAFRSSAASVVDKISDDGSMTSMTSNASRVEWAFVGAAGMLAVGIFAVFVYLMVKKYVICHKIEVEIASDAVVEELSENEFDKEQQAITGIMIPQDDEIDDDAQMIRRE